MSQSRAVSPFPIELGFRRDGSKALRHLCDTMPLCKRRLACNATGHELKRVFPEKVAKLKPALERIGSAPDASAAEGKMRARLPPFRVA
jgi:hypothetical protein